MDMYRYTTPNRLQTIQGATRYAGRGSCYPYSFGLDCYIDIHFHEYPYNNLHVYIHPNNHFHGDPYRHPHTNTHSNIYAYPHPIIHKNTHPNTHCHAHP
jgi:hypothetical protein